MPKNAVGMTDFVARGGTPGLDNGHLLSAVGTADIKSLFGFFLAASSHTFLAATLAFFLAIVTTIPKKKSLVSLEKLCEEARTKNPNRL